MTWSASRNKTGSPCVSATQGDFSAVLYILLSITEHFALRRGSLLPTAVDQRTSARYAGAAATRGPHAIRCTTIRTILVFAWYTAAVFSAPQPRRKSCNLRFQAAFLATFGAAAKSDPCPRARSIPFRCRKKWNRRRQKLKTVTRRRHPRPQARPHRKLHEKDAFWRPFQLFMYISSHARCASSRRSLTRIGTPNSPHVPIFSSKSVSASSVAANSTWYIF